MASSECTARVFQLGIRPVTGWAVATIQAMGRFRRSRTFYVLIAALFGAVSYQVIEFFYNSELDRIKLADLPDDPFNLLKQSLTVHDVSFILWIATSMVAGYLIYRLVASLTRALELAEERAGELAVVGELSARLSGPLTPVEVAAQFLDGIAALLPGSVTATLLQYEETAGIVRILAQRGGGLTPRPGLTYLAASLPGALRTRLIGEHKSFVLDDTATVPDWPALVAEVPGLAGARSFAALPLVSRARLLGALALADGRPGTIGRDQLQLMALLGQYVAGALHNALSIAEADERADREAVVNRIAQRLYSDLEPGAVIRSALEELGGELDVSRVLICGHGDRGEITVMHSWTRDGVEPLETGIRADLPLAALAVRDRRTIAVRDARVDPRLTDPTLGAHAVIEQGTIAGIATPITLGGSRTGVLVLHQVGDSRAWTSQEIRLLETVARELRTALEAADLLASRQRESERLLALHRASSLVSSETDPNEVLSEILLAAGTLLGRGSASLFRWDEQAGVLRQAESMRTAAGAASVLRPGEGATGEAFLSQRPVIVNDYATWSNHSPTNAQGGLKAVLAVPLSRAGQRIGVLTVGATDPETRFDDDDARLLGLFGDQAVAALTTADLMQQQRRAVEQLERVNAAKSDFVSIVSHEFRTPLTGIQGFSELMRDEDLSIAEMKEYAGDINTDAQRLNRMITEMLDLDRMESGRMTLHRDRIDLNALVAAAVDRVGTNAPRHQVRLNLDPELPLIDLDKDKIEQVLLNFLSNAIKYSPQGGAIVVSTRLEGDLAHVFVRDSGLGIPADSLEKVFERYSRLESGATRYIQGTGLGLPIARQIIEMHGGRAWVESTVGEGSVFQFTLPLVATNVQGG